MVFDVEKVRRDFPMLKQSMSGKPLIYLDSAASALKPNSVIETITSYYAEEYSTIHRSVYELSTNVMEKYSLVRRKIAKFINAASDEEIVFTRGTTESINLVAMCYGRDYIRAGDEIILTEMEHHSNLVPWQMLAQELGATIKYVSFDTNGILNLEEYKQLLGPKTKICAFAHASNAIGSIHPIKEMIALAHEVGAVCLVDGAQAIPHFDVDVQDLDCDFYAFSGHKMLGPTGIGVLYGKKDILAKMRPYHGGGDMVREVTLQNTTFQEAPLKFEAGTPMIAQVLGLGSAVEYLTSINRHATEQHETYLINLIQEEFDRFPGLATFTTSGPKVPLVSFNFQKIHALDLGTMLALKGIAIRTGTLCAQPAMNRFGQRSVCRISLAFYNTEVEVTKLLQSLQELTPLLTR